MNMAFMGQHRMDTGGSGLTSQQWAWLRLKDAVHAAKITRIEAQHLKSATLVAIEHDAFHRRYDEGDIRFKTQRALALLDRISVATATLEDQATAALAEHAAETVSWLKQIQDALMAGEAWSQTLVAELRDAESALTAQALAHVHRMETAMEQIKDAYGERWGMERSSLAQLVEKSNAAVDRAVHGQAEQLAIHHAETSKLRDTIEVLRNDLAQRELMLTKEQVAAAEVQDGLQDELARLREENATLRETALSLRGDAYADAEARAKERRATEALRRENATLQSNLANAYADLERLAQERMRERARLNSYLANLHEDEDERGGLDGPQSVEAATAKRAPAARSTAAVYSPRRGVSPVQASFEIARHKAPSPEFAPREEW